MTHEGLRLERQVQHLLSYTRIGDWKLLAELKSCLGKWIAPYLDAAQIASTITEGLPIEGQPALKEVKDLVDNCTAALGMDDELDAGLCWPSWEASWWRRDAAITRRPEALAARRPPRRANPRRSSSERREEGPLPGQRRSLRHVRGVPPAALSPAGNNCR